MPRTLSTRSLLEYILERGSVTSHEVKKHFDVNPNTARYHLEKLTEKGILVAHNPGKYGTRYSVNPIYIRTRSHLMLFIVGLTATITGILTSPLIASTIGVTSGDPLTSLISFVIASSMGVAAMWRNFLNAYTKKVENLLQMLNLNNS